MGDQSAIEWTEATWNPIRGCSRVSEGCRNCYAERQAIRQAGAEECERCDGVGWYEGGRALQTTCERCQGSGVVNAEPYFGLVESTPRGPRWTGQVRLAEDLLELPTRWKRPRRIFVNSMSDLFHEKVSFTWIDAIFSVMRRCPQHAFQVLTKRPDKMLDYAKARPWGAVPLPNVWLGVSVEDQTTADARIPLLLQTPAAVRWVSYEPALGPVDFAPKADFAYRQLSRWYSDEGFDSTGSQPEQDRMRALFPKLDWIVVGGESGPGARPFDLAWARQTIAQGRAAGVPVFVKQLGASSFEMCGEGSHPGEWADHLLWLKLRDRKGGDPAEWPEDLRVREYPR